jgi:tRNA-dihydrouridine synthase B
MTALTIGKVQIEGPALLLAPMEDVTDRPFRMICKEQGADIVYTEFVNAEGLIREQERGSDKTKSKLEFGDLERPLGIQIYGASELSMEQATKIATAERPDLIDINCGCWVSNVALRGAGAGLLRDPERMRVVVERVIGATDLPVTVKTRLGWDADSIRIVEVARMLEEVGVQALSIHCRTRAQGHKGEVDYSWIGRIKEAVSIPVIANGDINSAEDVHHVLSSTGCDGVMLGRGAIRHPWVFREARHLLRTGESAPAPTMTERIELCRRHLSLAQQYKGERVALITMRRHFAGYFRGLPGVSTLRAELAAVREAADLHVRLSRLLDSTGSETATA